MDTYTDTKTCTRCGTEKFLDEFHIQKKLTNGNLGRHAQCKECRSNKHVQTSEGITMEDTKAIYDGLSPEQQLLIDKIAGTFLYNFKSIERASKQKLGMLSARSLIFSLIDFVSKN